MCFQKGPPRATEGECCQPVAERKRGTVGILWLFGLSWSNPDFSGPYTCWRCTCILDHTAWLKMWDVQLSETPSTVFIHNLTNTRLDTFLNTYLYKPHFLCKGRVGKATTLLRPNINDSMCLRSVCGFAELNHKYCPRWGWHWFRWQQINAAVTSFIGHA